MVLDDHCGSVAGGDIDAVGSSWWNSYYDSDTYTALVPQCSNVVFDLSPAAPETRFINISFDLTENNTSRPYQITTVVRSPAANLLNTGLTAIVSDDD